MAERDKYISRIHPYHYGTRCGFGEVHYRPGGTCGPRHQSQYQLVLLVKGRSRLRWDGIWHPLVDGQAVLLTPGHDEWFEFSRTTGTHHIWIDWYPEYLPDDMVRRMPRTLAIFNPSPAALSLMQAGLHPQAPHPATLDHLGLAVLEECLATICPAPTPTPPPPALEKALACMVEQAEKPLTLAQIARASGVTAPHLVKVFRRHLKTTPMKHLWRLRTSRGRDSLLSTGLSVSEIAHRCGFQNAFHFSRLVRTRYGLSPRALRNKAWSKTGS